MTIDTDQLVEPQIGAGSAPPATAGSQTHESGQPATPAPQNLPRTIIRPASGWQLVNARELWQYRELVYFLTWRDVKVRYKQTVLGAAWAILQPAMMMVVFSIFFGRMAHVDTGGIPYPLFVFCGLLPWTFFATAIANAGNSVVGSERLITKIYFPRLAIPFASVGAALVDFAVAFSMLLALMLWYRVAPTWNLLLVPPLVMLFTLAALGVGALLAALNVAYRDFRYVIPFLVQIWMFATPTVYMQPPGGARSQESGVRSQGTNEGSGFRVQGSGVAERSPDRVANPQAPTPNPSSEGAVPNYLQRLLNLNPLTGLVAGFRAAVVGGPIPWSTLGWSTFGAALAFVVGCLYFRKVEDSFADII